MTNQIAQYIEEIRAAHIEDFKDRAAEVERFRVRFLGRKGIMNELFEQFKALPNDEKKEMGIALNQLKTAAVAKPALRAVVSAYRASSYTMHTPGAAPRRFAASR